MMDECTVRSDKSTDLKELVDKADLRSSNDDEFKDVNEDLQNGLTKAVDETESQLNDLTLNDKAKRVEDDASEDEYYDVTSDGSNSETSSVVDIDEHKSDDKADEQLPDEPDEHREEPQTVEDENKLDKTDNEREQGDGEVN